MANLNGKGPEEKGPRTGRGRGKCNKGGFSEEEWNDKNRDGHGYKKGRNRGKGRGFGLKNGLNKNMHNGNYNYDLTE